MKKLRKSKKRVKRQTRWFSAQLKFVALGKTRFRRMTDDSIVVFKAAGFRTAFRRALKIGKEAEHEYLNGDGQRVCWKLKEIVTLDIIHTKSIDGAEVWSSLGFLKKNDPIPFDAQFTPEDSKPGRTF